MASKVTCSSCGWSWNKSDSSKKDLYICHQCGKDNTMKDGGWLNKFEDAPEAQNGIEGTMGGLTDKGFNYNGAWGGTMQGGGVALMEGGEEEKTYGTFQLPEVVITGQAPKKGKTITKREDFEPLWNWASRKAGDVDKRQDRYGTLGDLYAYYAGQPLHYNALEYSEYKPTNAKNPNAKYISINDPKFKQEIFDKYNEVFIKKGTENQTFSTERERDRLKSTKINENTYAVSGYSPSNKEDYEEAKRLGIHPLDITGKKHVSNAIGRYFISKGKDDKGEYISYYDVFDEGSGPDGGGVGETLRLTKPFEIYDRIYLDPKTGKPKMAMGGSLPGAVGFTYARTQSPAPSNGPYAKKTKASAQFGEKVKPNDKRSQKFYNQLEQYYTRPDATEVEKATYKAFQQLNEQYGYAPVALKNKTIAGKRSMINPLTGRLNLVVQENEPIGEIKPEAKRMMEEYMNEYGHYQQYNEHPEYSKLRKAGNFLGDLTGDFGHMLKNLKGLRFAKAYNENYNTPGTTENEAHNIIQPKLQQELDENMLKNLDSRSRMPQLQNGQEMKYYQEGLDWKPKNISRDGGWLSKYDEDIPEAQFGLLKKAYSDFSKTYKPTTVTKEQRIKEIKENPASWSINDYKKFNLPEPGLETPDFDPIDLIGGGIGVKGALGAYGVYKNALKPFIVKGINIGSHPRSIARASGQIGKSLGGLTATGLEIAGGKENNYSTNQVYKEGGIIEDDMGQWAHPGEITKINSNQITMQGVDYPVLGISDTGDTKMMQPGQDYTYDGKSVTEIPMAQKGKIIPLKDLLKQEDEKLKGKADNTRLVQPVRQQPKVLIDPLTGKPPTADRQNIVRAAANPRNQGTIQTPYKRSPREQAIANLNTLDRRGDNAVASIVTAPIKAGLNLLRPDKYFEDVNSMSSLGDAVTSFGLDALTAIPAVEMASEASRYLGVPQRLGVLASDAKQLGSNFLGISPSSIPLAEQELINTFRNVGHIAKKTGASAKAEQFEALLKQGESLNDEMFFKLTGYNRSDVINKIGTLKQAESSGLKNFLPDQNDRYAAQLDRDAARVNRANAIEQASLGGPSAAEMRSAFQQQNYNPTSQEQLVASLTDDLANGRITQTQFQNNLEAQGIDMAAYLRGASVDDATNYAQQARGSQLDDIINISRSEDERMRFLDDLSAQVSNGTITEAEYMDRMSQHIRNRPSSPSYFDTDLDPIKVNNLSMYENAQSPIGRLNDKLYGNKYIPKTELAEDVNDLFIGLYTNEYNNPGLEMRRAYNQVAASPKGSSFLPARSLSSDSYPMSLRLTNRGLKSGIVDVNYHGMNLLNPSGFTQVAGLPMDINLKEINTLIKGLNTELPKSLPYAKIEGGQLMYPNFSVTRKKNGGWLNKYE
jgi:hypothetical protein